MRALGKGFTWTMRWAFAGVAFGFCAWWGADIARGIGLLVRIAEVTR